MYSPTHFAQPNPHYDHLGNAELRAKLIQDSTGPGLQKIPLDYFKRYFEQENASTLHPKLGDLNVLVAEIELLYKQKYPQYGACFVAGFIQTRLSKLDSVDQLCQDMDMSM